MPYPIEVEDKIEYRAYGPGKKFSYQKGLEIADRVNDYLKANNATLVTGPGELSQESIRIWNNAGDWVYHLKDTTLFSEMRPGGYSEKNMHIAFAAAGRNTKKILSDLQKILDEY